MTAKGCKEGFITWMRKKGLSILYKQGVSVKKYVKKQKAVLQNFTQLATRYSITFSVDKNLYKTNMVQ
jgi:hypothetical protein